MQGTSSFNASPIDETVQTTVVTGEWLYLKDAAAKIGLSEKTLRRYMKKRALKTRRVGKSANSPIQVFVTADLRAEIEDVDLITATTEESIDELVDEEKIDFEPSPSSSVALDINSLKSVINECVQPLVARLEQQASIIVENEKVIAEQSIQLRLLPDLEKSAREKEEAAKLQEFELQALRHQVTALEAVKAEAEEKAQTSAFELLEARTRLARYEKPWWKKFFLPREIDE